MWNSNSYENRFDWLKIQKLITHGYYKADVETFFTAANGGQTKYVKKIVQNMWAIEQYQNPNRKSSTI